MKSNKLATVECSRFTYSRQQIIELAGIFKLNPKLSDALSVALDSPLWNHIHTADEALFVLQLLEKIQAHAMARKQNDISAWIEEGLAR